MNSQLVAAIGDSLVSKEMLLVTSKVLAYARRRVRTKAAIKAAEEQHCRSLDFARRAQGRARHVATRVIAATAF